MYCLWCSMQQHPSLIGMNPDCISKVCFQIQDQWREVTSDFTFKFLSIAYWWVGNQAKQSSSTWVGGRNRPWPATHQLLPSITIAHSKLFGGGKQLALIPCLWNMSPCEQHGMALNAALRSLGFSEQVGLMIQIPTPWCWVMKPPPNDCARLSCTFWSEHVFKMTRIRAECWILPGFWQDMNNLIVMLALRRVQNQNIIFALFRFYYTLCYAGKHNFMTRIQWIIIFA